MYLGMGGRTLGETLHQSDSINYFPSDTYII